MRQNPAQSKCFALLTWTMSPSINPLLFHSNTWGKFPVLSIKEDVFLSFSFPFLPFLLLLIRKCSNIFEKAERIVRWTQLNHHPVFLHKTYIVKWINFKGTMCFDKCMYLFNCHPQPTYWTFPSPQKVPLPSPSFSSYQHMTIFFSSVPRPHNSQDDFEANPDIRLFYL